MKNLFLISLLFFSISAFGQNISGLYAGTLYNDSTKGTQQYELALSEYRGKITGYAYATFIANDTFYYSIRRVKAVRNSDQLVVEDGDMLANNFPVRADKGVYRTTSIPLQNLKESDTLTTFSGNWKTNRTKRFYSVPGTMAMKRSNDSTQSNLIAHLRELQVIPTETQALPNPAPLKETLAAGNEKSKTQKSKLNTGENTHGVLKKLDSTIEKTTLKPSAGAEKITLSYTERKKYTQQVFEVRSDSLVLHFYDNGVVDGDVISVYMNGEPVVSNTKLLEAALKKTIYLPATTGPVELLLVAETLGSIPPNTGLLVVQDGSARYEVRFSADLQTNAAIVFRKK